MTRAEAIDYIEEWKTDYSVDAKDREVLSMAIKALEIVNDFETAQIITGGRLNGRTYAYKCGLADGQRLAKDEKILEQQPCEDCISRAELLKAFETECAEECECCDKHRDNGMSFLGNYKSWCGLIAELPPVTPKPKIGKWIILDECANEGVYCSECHKKVFKLEFNHTMKWRKFKYCPNCGAKMEVKE